MSDICAPQPVHAAADHHVPELPRICEAEWPRGGSGHLPVYDDERSPSYVAFGDGLQAERDRQTADWRAEGDAIFAEVQERLALGSGGFVGSLVAKEAMGFIHAAREELTRLVRVNSALKGDARPALEGAIKQLIRAGADARGIMTQATRLSAVAAFLRNGNRLGQTAFDALKQQIDIIRAVAREPAAKSQGSSAVGRLSSADGSIPPSAVRSPRTPPAAKRE